MEAADLENRNSKPVGAVMVVGAGIAGIQSSLDLANSGFKVYLVEQSPAIGGTMAQLDKTFPTNDCAMCIMSPKLVECGRHFNIELITCAEVQEVNGTAGNFNVKILRKPRYVDVSKCTGCGECEKVCPVSVPSVFDESIVNGKAIFRPFAQASPNAFAISKMARPPCQEGCPAHVHVQGYIALIRERKYREAYDLIRESNPFPCVCGTVCTHPCESRCRRGEYDQPVAVRALKRFVADYANEHKDAAVDKPSPSERKPDKVAIVGSGPGGLTCGYDLARLGYQVVVYEASPHAGGMLRVAIPKFRLPRHYVDNDIDYIKDWGVEIRLNAPVGDPRALLDEGHSAVFLATGAHVERKLGMEGEDLEGVYYGLDFLRKVNLDEPVKVGRKVAVIGGGNSAIDAARTAFRLGAEEVSIVYRRSRVEMPADEEEIREAEEEGIRMEYLSAPRKIIGQGRVTGMECVRMKLGPPDESGRRRPIPVDGSEFVMDVDTIIPSIGQQADLSYLPGKEEIARTRWQTLVADETTLQTSVPGIFAGGDLVLGPSSVIDAIAQGRRAAVSIDRFIRGEDLALGRGKTEELPQRHLPEVVEDKPRQVMPVLPAEERARSFAEPALGYTEEQALKEADRCLECGVCSECLECVRVCEADAIDHSMKARTENINVGAIILSDGAEKFSPAHKYEFGYGRYPNVVTSIEFERILAASGPFAGHVQRPHDGKVPKRVAWIQCVGSRDEREGRGYCSSVCCMYAIKEATIAKEHVKEIEPTIFYMDIRAHGKDFDAFFNRARDQHGVRFVRSRVGKVLEVPESGNLLVYYTTEDNPRQLCKEFDMVVLSVGLGPGRANSDLADTLGVKLNEYDFFKTSSFAPVTTSRPGIFVCGLACGPKDIPETVMEASGAAAAAESVVAEARGTEIVPKTYPQERDVRGEQPRIGVFVCHCGINIGSVVEVPGVVEFARQLPGVVYAEENLFTCSQDTQQKITDTILEQRLNRIVIASCSPRTHEPLFQETLREAGLNPCLFEMANIRDQCSWIHGHAPREATDKAKTLVRMAVAKAGVLEPLHAVMLPVVQKALVIGGGLAGMTVALSLADQGFDAVLVEREDKLGGNLRNLYQTIQGDDVQQYLASLVGRVEEHPGVEVYRSTTIKEIEGYIGNYRTKLDVHGQKPEGEGQAEQVTIEHGVVVVATGARESRPREYLHGEDGRVITQVELEKRLQNPQEHKLNKLKNVVMIQCVGSRDDERPYCSRVCCQDAVKNALRLRELNPKVNIYVLYRDMRTYGFFEEYYRRARDSGVTFIRHEREEKPKVEKDGDDLAVRTRDLVLGADLTINPDLVVLAPAIVPQDDAATVSRMLKVPLNENNFFLEAHVKLRPVDFATEGVFLAGLAHSPKNITETIAQAKAAAARAGTILSKDGYEAGATTSVVDEDICAGCGLCVANCPYNAPELVERADRVVSHVNEALCKGCGNCAAVCPSGAISHLGFKSAQTEAMISAALRFPSS